ncbi:DUF1404 domain-containing protein [Candidatus Acidianus copahuensis]|nr:DUF1404 domain-containing protein [Candidatus Acidianus copahuensis]
MVITVNPSVEELMNYNVIPYMLAHYSLFAAGSLLGYSSSKKTTFAVIPGIFLGILWHIPFFFNLGVTFLWIRGIEEFSLVIGGYLLGVSLHDLGWKIKTALLVLWMLGDTFLSTTLMISPALYTKVYPISQPYILGIIMFLLMNIVVVSILLEFMYKKMLSEEKEFEKKL